MLLLFIIASFLVFLLFYLRPSVGFWLTLFCAPFIGLMFDFSQYEWSRYTPYFGQIQAPVADILALVLFIAVVAKIFIEWFWGLKSAKPVKYYYQLLLSAGFFYILPFLLVGLASLYQVPGDQLSSSFKYWLRPVCFFFLMWVLLPVYIIDTPQKLGRAIKILFGVGLASALMGFLSLFITPSLFGVWSRVTPIVFWGLAPLTTNHNVLAEVLVMAAPLAYFLFAVRANQVENDSRQVKNFYVLSFIFITAVALLTFSRAAWIALLVQFLLYFWLKYFSHGAQRDKGRWDNIKPLAYLAPIVILPLFLYMLSFSFSPIVLSSNATRLDLTEIAWTYFARNPLLGNGVGTFVPLVAETRLFTVEYGDPLDAHGVLQKLIAEEGILGTITYFLFIGWVLSALYRSYLRADDKYRILFLCLLLAVVGGVVYQFFNTSYYNQHLWLPVGVALAARRILSRE